MARTMFLALDRAISGRLLLAAYDHILGLDVAAHPGPRVLTAIERFGAGQEPHTALQSRGFDEARTAFHSGISATLTADEWGLLAVWYAYQGWAEHRAVDGILAQVVAHWVSWAMDPEAPRPMAEAEAWVEATHREAAQASDWQSPGGDDTAASLRHR